MAKKTGLGKGLDALFVNNEIAEDEQIREGEVVQKLNLREVEPNRNQPRKIFDDEKIEELANSIKEYGVIQPIIVTKEDNYYRIVRNPFRGPNDRRVLRLDVGKNKVEIVSKYKIDSYTVKYIRQPEPIILSVRYAFFM